MCTVRRGAINHRNGAHWSAFIRPADQPNRSTSNDQSPEAKTMHRWGVDSCLQLAMATRGDWP